MSGNIIDDVDYSIILRLYESSISAAEYKLNDANTGRAFYTIIDSEICAFETTNASGGILNIHYFDADKYIISGTFEFTAVLNEQDSGHGCRNTVRVTDGRFDIKYIP